MTVSTLFEESLLQKSFYVPRFELSIEGSGLPRDVLGDVTQITYKDNIKEIDSFELVVNNWDAITREFKYVGTETQESLDDPSGTGVRHRFFEPCAKTIVIKFGYLDELVTMIRGFFTTMEPNFPSTGAPTLNVRGMNVLHRLRKKQYTTSWENLTDSQIAENLATLPDPQSGQRRFPLPIRTDSHAKAEEQPRPYVAQENQYDLDFLLSLARRNAYVIRVDPRRGGGELYFGPSEDSKMRAVEYRLGWGRSLVEFKPTLTTANQVKSVTVNGWNRRTRRAISETVSLDDREFRNNRNLKELLMRCDPREEQVVHEPVSTPAEARRRARSILMDRSREMVKATGTTVGLPNLRAGVMVHIENIGSRFSGRYFVTETTHSIGASGYTTKFSARREDPEEES